jgi:hypothetical protein
MIQQFMLQLLKRLTIILYLNLGLLSSKHAFSEPLMDSTNLYLYCQESQRYYPDVLECPEGWIKVSPSLRDDQPLIYLNTYPNLVQIPQYPVYYDPYSNFNYFFYDGLYWIFINDLWYSSTWFNGPWYYVSPNYIPFYLLRVPIRYYRQPSRYFLMWDINHHPHWNELWGPEWERQHQGWNQWDKKHTPRAAPLPLYQREYLNHRYPKDPDDQQLIHSRQYQYQPKEMRHFEKSVEPNGASIESKRDMFIPRELAPPQIKIPQAEGRIQELNPAPPAMPFNQPQHQRIPSPPPMERFPNQGTGRSNMPTPPRPGPHKR